MKLWSGRFSKQTASEMDDFHSSIHFDKRLYKQDIEGSIAHASMLYKVGIITKEDKEKILHGLKSILEDIENDKIEFTKDSEDIHMNIETLLTERIGDAGKRLHTGRSRNDQVATDTRLYCKEEIAEIVNILIGLEKVLLKKSTDNLDTIMPGYTHMQKAQPITLAHYLMAYFEMFKRDIQRLFDCKKRTDVMPLGSGALAGTIYPLDRDYTANMLGFSNISANSLDAVSDRDFVIELLSCLSIIMMHLSRFCEELIIWSTNEFDYIEMDDAYATGSSIMPQKKNPDAAELIRGKTGRVYGDLMSLLTVMKSLPLAYNKDMQEDKESLFDGIDTVKGCLNIFTNMLSTSKFKKEVMYENAKKGFLNATDAADYLVNKGIPFRNAHEVSGKIVAYCISHNLNIEDLSIKKLKEFSDKIEEDIYGAVKLENCVNNRNIPGSPAPVQTESAIKTANTWLNTATTSNCR